MLCSCVSRDGQVHIGGTIIFGLGSLFNDYRLVLTATVRMLIQGFVRHGWRFLTRKFILHRNVAINQFLIFRLSFREFGESGSVLSAKCFYFLVT